MFSILKRDSHSQARIGIIETAHGQIETPAYAIVGTEGEVRTLTNDDVKKTGTQLIIVNAYHMWLNQFVKTNWSPDHSAEQNGLGLALPRLHDFMGWRGPLMTDSGGFQVFSMRFPRAAGITKIVRNVTPQKTVREKGIVRIADDGVYFTVKGNELHFNPELSMRIQERLGADIIFAFDECTAPTDSYQYTKEAMERTHRWAARSLKAKRSDQLLYGIVQGGMFEDLRKESARFIGNLPFDGIGIGGAFGASEHSGKPRFKELEWVIPLLPEGKPRHLLGVGKIEDIFAAVAQGIDTFDCVIPTREARHGAIWTSGGRLNIKKSSFRGDSSVLDVACACPVCTDQKMERRELHRLFKEKNSEAGRLATMHNVFFFNDLMKQIRVVIQDGTFRDFYPPNISGSYFDFKKHRAAR